MIQAVIQTDSPTTQSLHIFQDLQVHYTVYYALYHGENQGEIDRGLNW